MKVIFDLVKYNKSIYFSYSVFLRQHELAKTYTLVDSFIHGNFLLVALVSLLTQAFFFFLRNSPVHYTRLYIPVVGCIQYLFHRALVFPYTSRDVAGYQFHCLWPFPTGKKSIGCWSSESIWWTSRWLSSIRVVSDSQNAQLPLSGKVEETH